MILLASLSDPLINKLASESPDKYLACQPGIMSFIYKFEKLSTKSFLKIFIEVHKKKKSAIKLISLKKSSNPVQYITNVNHCFCLKDGLVYSIMQ